MSEGDKKEHRHKRPQLSVSISQLHLDKENPRLPEEAQGKTEQEVLQVLWKEFNLDELAESMSKNGYFAEEPMVAIPMGLPSSLMDAEAKWDEFEKFVKEADTEFTVVEGNRRLATAQLLLNGDVQSKISVRHWPKLTTEVREDLETLPIIVYATRTEVVPYLGVRHIVGIQKWDSYAKARYVAKMVDKGRPLSEVEALIVDTQRSVRKNYLAFKLLEQVQEEFDYDTRKAKKDFSLLILAIGQGKIKRFLGLPTKVTDINESAPVPRGQLKNLRSLMSWIFGDERRLQVIKESRDITSYLSHVVESAEATKHLERTRDLAEAYDLSDGEEQMVLRYLGQANKKLEAVLGLLHRHKTTDVRREVEKCAETAKELVKKVRDEE